MILKNLVTVTLLFVLGFSIVHEYAFAFLDDEHATAIEYVAELEAPSNHGDICDAHSEYHQSFVLTPRVTSQKIEQVSPSRTFTRESYNFTTYENFLKPPIV